MRSPVAKRCFKKKLLKQQQYKEQSWASMSFLARHSALYCFLNPVRLRRHRRGRHRSHCGIASPVVNG